MASRFTLDSATEFLFGRSVDSMDVGFPYPESSPLANSPAFLNHPSNTYVKSFVQSQLNTVQRGPFGTKWPLKEFWKDRVKPHRKIVDDYIEPILNAELERKANERADGEKKEEGGTFLSHLVQSTDGAGTILQPWHWLMSPSSDKEVIRDAIFNTLIAGRDTVRKNPQQYSVIYSLEVQTAATLTFGVYMLAEHPEIAERLRNEILSTIGPSKMPTYDDLRSMRYLRAFINGA
jgi:cytochrome P450